MIEKKLCGVNSYFKGLLKKIVCLSVCLTFFESADARDLGLMTLFVLKWQSWQSCMRICIYCVSVLCIVYSLCLHFFYRVHLRSFQGQRVDPFCVVFRRWYLRHSPFSTHRRFQDSFNERQTRRIQLVRGSSQIHRPIGHRRLLQRIHSR